MMFFKHFKNSQDAKDYHAHLSHDDYHAKGAPEHRPVYQGKTAELLGISGMEATRESFYALCDNRHPVTGEKLTARDKDDRRIMTDITLDVPKAVSLAALYDDRVEKVVAQSIDKTMGLVEDDMCVRVRKGGKNEDKVSGNILYTVWPHETTRPLEDGTVDMHKHRHVTVMNVSFDAEEGALKACQFGNIVRDKAYYQAAYHSWLAHGLNELGYGIRKDGHSFTLAGIGRETVDKFSRRTAVIEAEAKAKGIIDPAAKADLGRKTRNRKGEEPQSMSQLRAEWDARLSAEERLAIRTAGSGLAKGDDAIGAMEAKNYALEHSFENASAVTEKRLKAEALTHAVGSVLPRDVDNIGAHPEVIRVKHAGEWMATTKQVLNNEVAMLEFARDGQRKFRPLVDTASLSTDTFAGLSEEQRKAALHLLKSRDTVMGVAGKAGTGKTRMMRATVEAIEGAGHRVFVFAPSSQASRGVLKNTEGFANAETLEMLLTNEKLQEQTKGQVLWVDEAGLISSRDMRRLMDVAKRNGSRVILSGDYTQHASVEAGDAFRLMEKEAGVSLARLSENRRQTEPGYRKAVEQISSGSSKGAQKGFDALESMGWVFEASGEERHAMLVNDYLQAAGEGKSALIIAPTHAEGAALTDALRTALKEQGALGAERSFVTRRGTGWTQAEKGDARNYEPGMVVEFHQNAKGFTRGDKAVVVAGENGPELLKRDGTRARLPLTEAKRFEVYRTRELAIAKGDRIRITKNGEAKVAGQAKGTRINNGDIFTVEGFTKEGDIRLEKGKLLPKDWGHMALGYVDTSYASQGKTVDRVFIAAGNESIPAVGRQQWYVSATRGREMARLYVDSKEEVRAAIAKSPERLSAVELTHTRLRSNWRQRVAETIKRNRVSHFFKTRIAAVAGHWRGREGVSYG